MAGGKVTISAPQPNDAALLHHGSTGRVNRCVKYAMFVFNVLFWLCGSAILIFGVWGLLSKSGFSVETFAEEIGLELDPMYAFVIVGAAIFILGFLGCIGALRENTFLLKVFQSILIFIFVAEMAVGLLIYIFQDRFIGLVNTTLEKTIVNYFDDSDSQFVLDTIQDSLVCCGAAEPNDWELNIYFNCSSIAHSRCSVPFSCCLPDPLDPTGVVNYQCGYDILARPLTTQRDYIYTVGCVDAMEAWFLGNAIWLGCIGCVLVLLQFFAIMMAKNLIVDINDIKAKW